MTILFRLLLTSQEVQAIEKHIEGVPLKGGPIRRALYKLGRQVAARDPDFMPEYPARAEPIRTHDHEDIEF